MLSEEADSLHVFWPNPQFDRWVDADGDAARRRRRPAARAFRTALFGDHAYHLTPTTEVVRKVTEREARLAGARAPSRQRRAGDRRRHRSGERRARRRQRAARMEGRRRAAAAAARAPRRAARAADADGGRSIVHIKDPRRESAGAALRLFPAAGALAPRRGRSRPARRALMQGEPPRRLRLAKGVSYALDVDADSAAGRHRHGCTGTSTSTARRRREALDILRDWFDRAQPFADRPPSASSGCAGRRRAAAALNDTQPGGSWRARSSAPGTWAGRRPCWTTTRAISRASRTKDVVAALDACREERGDLRARPRTELTEGGPCNFLSAASATPAGWSDPAARAA